MRALILAHILLQAAAPALADNLHLIESRPNGFAVYRSGAPDSAAVAEYCRIGIEEIAVLAGDADRHELRYRRACPALAVVYDEKQDPDDPLTVEFLEWFDQWVEGARRDGRKIAFRCDCGCHRAGRLAAYYQMKYQHLTLEDALVVMFDHGKDWQLHRNIEPQVRALKDYLDGKPCAEKAVFCVRGVGRGADRPAAASQ